MDPHEYTLFFKAIMNGMSAHPDVPMYGTITLAFLMFLFKSMEIGLNYLKWRRRRTNDNRIAQ